MRIRKYDYKDQQGEKIEITFNNPRGLQKIYLKLKTLINNLKAPQKKKPTNP